MLISVNPKNILVVQIGKLGDMVLTSPLFYELKKLYPDAKVKVLASNVNKEFAGSLKCVDEVIVYQKNVFRDLLLASNLKKNEFDLWIDVKDGYSRTSSALLKFARPKLSLGFNYDEKIFDVDLKEYIKGEHAIDLSLAPIYYAGAEPTYKKPVLTDFIKKAGEGAKYEVTINVSAGSPSRYWGLQKWIELITLIQKKYNLKINLIGIKSDSQLILDIKNNLNSDFITINYDLQLSSLINVLNSSKIVITPDTSIVHLASGLNKPLLGLYPNVEWNNKNFKPLSDNFQMVVSKSDKGIEDIEVNEVFEKFEKLYNQINQSK